MHRRSPIAFAVAAALSLCAVPPLHAQTGKVELQQAARALGPALDALAAKTGARLLYSPEAVKGKQAPALAGNLSTEDALSRVLAGSGLTWTRSADGAYAIKVATAEKVAELATIEVKDEAVTPYVAKRSSAGTKTDTSILETPMAIQVIPREVIDDRQSRTALDVAKNVSGVQIAPGAVYDQFLLRGFDSGYGVTYRNGMKLEGVGGAVNSAFVDHVEVIKGPASMLYGRIEPGGFVNVVTKKPQADSAFSVQQQVGSWGQYRTTLDATGKVNEDGSVLYRVIGAYDKADSYIDFAHRDNKAVAAYFAFKPSARFEANLNLEYYDEKQTHPRDGGIPVIGNRPANLPRNFSLSDPLAWSNFPYTLNRTLLGFDWTYALNDSWKVSQRFHYNKSSGNYASISERGGGSFNGTDTIQRYFYDNPVDRETFNTNLEISGKFATGDIRHNILIGMDYFSYHDVWSGGGLARAAQGIPDLNIYNPVYGNINFATLQAEVNRASQNVIWKNQRENLGIYLQDQIDLGNRWQVLLSGRFDKATGRVPKTYGWYTDTTCYPNCTGSPLVEEPKISDFSPRLGVLYKLSNAASVYASYTESFGSNNGFSASGSPFPPQKGVQYELGVKASLFDGKITTSATLFDLEKRNIKTPDLVNPLLSVVTGEVRSRGLELDLAGQVTKHISVIGNYTYNDVIITKDNTVGANATQGNRWAGVPLHSSSWWAKYDTAPGASEGWAVGLGVYLNGQRQGNNTNTWQLPGYGRVDAMLAYRTKAGGKLVTAQLNVDNLFNKTYWTGIGTGTYAYYGAPRSVMGSVKVEF
jgi:iron complex outermembrane receptor protein